MPNSSICVYCGSRSGSRPAYQQAAQAFGTGLANKGWRLVFGAGDVGLMGAVSAAARAAGGETLGIIPTHLLGKEARTIPRDPAAGRPVITQDMHERKKVMFMNSDAIAVLPGGGGSMDEFFEVLTWRSLGLHEKPILLLNTEGYWDPLLGLLTHMAAEGFADASLAEGLLIASQPEEGLEMLADAMAAQPPS